MTNKEKCTKLWILLYKNPGMTKEEAYEQLGFEPNMDNIVSETCPACVEAQERMEADMNQNNVCSYCPMKDHWPDINGEHRLNHCSSNLGPKSAFDAWSNMTRRGAEVSRHSQEAIKTYAGYILKTIEHWK